MAITQRQGTKRRPGKKGYWTLKADTPEDIRKLKGSELLKQIDQQGKGKKDLHLQDLAKNGETVVFPSGKKVQYTHGQAEYARSTMRALGRKPPATRPTFTMPGYFKTVNGKKVLVREGDPDY